MSSNKHIENLFKDSLGEFHQKPSSKVWFKVQKMVLPAKVKYLCQQSLSGFHHAPSASIWAAVNARLIWFRFLYFNPYTFNVYYLGAAMLVGGLGLAAFTVLNNKTGQYIHTPIALNKRIVETDIDFREAFHQIDRYQQQTAVATGVVYRGNIDAATNKQTVLYSDNHNQVDNAENAIADSDVLPGRQVDLMPDSNIPVAESSPKISELSTESPIFIQRLPISSFQQKLKFKPEPYDFERLAFGSFMQLHQPIVPDTLGYDSRGEPIVVAGQYFSYEPFWSVVSGRTHLFSQNEEMAVNLRDNPVEYNIVNTGSSGLHVAFQHRHFRAVSGLAYTNYRETYTQESSTSIVQYSIEHYIRQFEGWQRDTSWILDLNSWLQGDTVYFAFVDSVYFSYSDTIMTVLADTVTKREINQRNAEYAYFEIPIIAGYTFQHRNWYITPQTGLLTGFFTRASGYYPTDTGLSLEMSNLHPLRSVQFSWYAGCNLRYYFSHNVGIMAEPWVTRSLTPAFSKDVALNRYNMRYGLRIGLSVRI